MGKKLLKGRWKVVLSPGLYEMAERLIGKKKTRKEYLKGEEGYNKRIDKLLK